MIKVIKNLFKGLDWASVNGLTGVENSLAYRVHEIERHFHSYERWFEVATTPSGETHVADAIGSGSGAFQADAGNDDWGSWLQILGSSDTPAISGSAKFNFHEIFINAAERSFLTYVQIGFGASGAAALSAGSYSEFVIKPSPGVATDLPAIIQGQRQDAGTKTWLRLKVPGQNTGTLDFLFGIHEYEG